MKFKIDKSSPIYDSLVNLHKYGKVCEDAANEWVKNKFGKKLNFASPEGVLWGGVAAVQFISAKKGWKQINARHKLYAPQRDIDKKSAEALPVVTKQELKDLLAYGNYPCPTGINTIPSVTLGDGYALIAVPDAVRGYEPIDGMVEILGSEYNTLYDAAEAWNSRDLRSESEV